jgi:hypothetical protein
MRKGEGVINRPRDRGHGISQRKFTIHSPSRAISRLRSFYNRRSHTALALLQISTCKHGACLGRHRSPGGGRVSLLEIIGDILHGHKFDAFVLQEMLDESGVC